MAETPGETAPATEIGSETKKIVNPRVEIDTSPPFGSVKEAVTHFGGSGSWIPHHLLRLAAHHGFEEYDLDKVEAQAAALEKDLIAKERETLGVLRELEATKQFVEGLKMKLVKEVSECMATPETSPVGTLSLCPAASPGLILMELNQAKLDLSKSTNNLAAIQASVDSLNKKMTKEKTPMELNPPKRELPNTVTREKINSKMANLQLANHAESKGDPRNPPNISRQLQQFNFESDQFKKIAAAAKYEVMKAMSEIEQTKTSINMVEMRLIAARKMEEAARAVEAIASAEMRARSSSTTEGVTLSFEEYCSLTQKAQKAEELSKKRVRDAMSRINESNASELAILKKPEEKSEEEAMRKVEAAERRKFTADEAFFRGRMERGEMRPLEHNATFKFKNSYPSYGHRDSQLIDEDESNMVQEKTVPVLRSTISIGDILSRKLILQDNFVVGNHVEGRTGRQQVSLSEMLREQSGLIFEPKKAVKEGFVHKQFFTQRKKFGFIDISLPLTKQSKKKAQAAPR
ncbi:hypothetical protein Vadar_017595 [Vaccinium darrowii]|uniref:Uncharacterized protein n=1 Tax=Vaccinium darrowii TaxID=229202 RepID=A0ACB7YM97_9ERIC|nr:hypothetical protein Vadar_017595 [Vaccinium darrowii]